MKPNRKPKPAAQAPSSPASHAASLSHLSGLLSEHFDVEIPVQRPDRTERMRVRVRRLTAAEDAEVNLLVRRVVPAAFQAAGDGKTEPSPEAQAETMRKVEIAQLQARALALTTAVPIIRDALTSAEIAPDDITSITTWLQQQLPEQTLAILFNAVVGDPTATSGRAVGFF